jgi:predicted DNA-binding transcriptional regulator AlpA
VPRDPNRDPGTSREAAPTEPLLLVGLSKLAALLDRSVASLNRDLAAGRLPAPVRLGGSRKWRWPEIEAWVAAGCPPCPPGAAG